MSGRAIVLTAIALGAAPPAHADCTRHASLRLESQGTATETVVFLHAAGCAVTGRVRFSVQLRGDRAPIRHNPITAVAGPADDPHFWWGNWCGPRTRIVVQATWRGRTVSARPSVLPACLQRNRPSFLTLPA